MLAQTVDDDNAALVHEFGLGATPDGLPRLYEVNYPLNGMGGDFNVGRALLEYAGPWVGAGALIGFLASKNWKGAALGSIVGAGAAWVASKRGMP